MPATLPEPALEDTAPADRFCDVVMKGGITSGVVYPLAITELAKAYRFKNIGGSSAGAIAAALTAAAEFARRHGSMRGFSLLRGAPDELRKCERVGGPTKLLSLFQPSPKTSRLFNVLLSTLNQETAGGRWASGVAGVLQQYWLAIAAGIAAALGVVGDLALLGQPRIALAFAAMTLLFVLVFVVLWVSYDVANGLVSNGFGLCKGGPNPDGEPQALVTWLHESIQGLAAKPLTAPLTFHDLWNAPKPPPAWLDPVKPGELHSINLVMLTANLAHGRPYMLPLQDDASRLFYSPKDWESYFPPEVMRHLEDHSHPHVPEHPADPRARPVPPDLRLLPREHMPVVVAARLSLSFPLLLSAVPVWAIDHAARLAKDRRPRRCWLSDGGICSNFPIHLFDSFLPRWPTFGITLDDPEGSPTDEKTWLPKFHDDGHGDRWNRGSEDDYDDKSLHRLGNFLGSIVNTVHNWNDNTLGQMPGVRDRVVHIGLKEHESGLNINMLRDTIKDVSGYGQQAGIKLREKFAAAAGGTHLTPGWKEHRWVRFNVLVRSLRERLEVLSLAARLDAHALPLDRQIAAATLAPPLNGRREQTLTIEQANALQQVLDAIEQGGRVFAGNAVEQPYRPQPAPGLRIRPPL